MKTITSVIDSAALTDAAALHLREGGPALAPQGDDPASARDLVVSLSTHRVGDPAFCIRWQALVADSGSPQKIYQTPAFFKFLQETRKPGERVELLTIVRLSDGATVGVVPLCINQHELLFNIGPLKLHRAKVDMINLLGSIPAIPGGSAVADYLATQMLAMFPSAKAVFMQAIPAESAHWNDLGELGTCAGSLATSRMGPWRECHTMALPNTFDLYLGKFSAKKRYNLNRQIRQLSEQAGALELDRIEQPGQVEGMLAGLHTMLSAEEKTCLMRLPTYQALAAQGLLLCYVLRAGGQVMAAILATRSAHTVHIHNIFVGTTHTALSVGTSVMHLAIKDLTELGLKSIDFGYGTPNHEFRSSHVLETRAQVLLFDRTKSISLLFFIHRHFRAVSEGAIGLLKALRKQVQGWRKAQLA